MLNTDAVLMVKDIIVIYRKKWIYFGFNQFGNVIFRILEIQYLT